MPAGVEQVREPEEGEKGAAPGGGIRQLWQKEDWWAVWLGLGLVALALAAWAAGASIRGWAVTPGTWSRPGELLRDLGAHAGAWVALLLLFGAAFTVSVAVMGRKAGAFVPGFVVLFVAALAVFYLAGWDAMKRWDLGAPLLALVLGLVFGNVARVPAWLERALLTEYYIKTGIVLLGATLPLTLIVTAGPVAFLQATVVSVTTWLTIYLAATRLFGLEPRFGAVLGAGGAVCGVSASIAVGGAVKAHKDHIAIAISVVSVWAIVMIFALTFATKWLVPDVITPGEAGAWIGTSEFADAAGLAVVAELAGSHGEAPLQTFTLMKVIGRDMWIGIWCLILSVVSVVSWERVPGAERRRVGGGVVWERFPKFVLGFLAASVIMSAVAASAPAGAEVAGPGSDWFRSVLTPEVIAPIKALRSWAFVLCFLSIGLSTRFAELATFGLRPLWAFTLGVAVNVPLGWFLSTVVFSGYWSRI